MIKNLITSLIAVLLCPFHKKSHYFNLKYAKKILVFQLSGIGNSIMLIPFLKNLRVNFKNSNIYFLCDESICDVFRDTNLIDNFIPVKSYLFKKLSFLFRLLILLRKYSFDVAFLCFPNQKLKGVLLTFLSGTKVRVGHRYKCGLISNCSLLLNYSSSLIWKHESEMNLDLLRKCNLRIRYQDISLNLNVSDKIKNFLKRFKEKKKICFHLGKNLDRNWGTHNFELVAEKILNNFDSYIFLLGTRIDLGFSESFLRKYSGKVFDLRGKFSLHETMEIIKESDLIIGNDTGLIHIAEALKKPLLTIFGPTDYRRTGLYKPNKNQIMIYKSPKCWPCYEIDKEIKCQNKVCFSQISIQEVFEKASKILRNL